MKFLLSITSLYITFSNYSHLKQIIPLFTKPLRFGQVVLKRSTAELNS